MARRKARRTQRSQPQGLRPVLASYAQSTREPLYSLMFLLPLIAAYEFGAMIVRPFTHPERRLIAPFLIEQFLGWFGAAGAWVPGVLLLAILVVLHVRGGKPWQVKAWVWPIMLVESVLLALPLLALARLALTASVPGLEDLKLRVLLGVGASLYEELLFRLILLSAAVWLLTEVVRMPRPTAVVVAAILASLLFSACHFKPIGGDPYSAPLFLVRALAGGYLSLVFLTRGLGICTGCHAAYNVILLLSSAPSA